MQCGRSNKMEIEIFDSLKEFLATYPKSFMFNFSKNYISNNKTDIKSIVIGCEGGFSDDEIDLFDDDKIVGIDSDMILRSQNSATKLK